MEGTECQIKCPIHTKELIKRVDFELGEETELYCFECLLNLKNPLKISPQLKTIDEFIDIAAKFYETHRQKANENSDTPEEYAEILTKQAQNLVGLQAHVEAEKKRVEAKFDELTQEVVAMINTKRNEYLRLLDNQLFNYKHGFTFFEKQLRKAFPKIDDQSLYPTKEEILEKYNNCKDSIEFLAFIRNLKEDIHENKLFNDDERSNPELARRLLIKTVAKKLDEYKVKLPTLIIADPDLTKPRAEVEKALAKLIDSSFELSNEIEDLSQGEGNPKSSILKPNDFNQLRKWLDKEWSRKKMKLIFKGSRDGMTSSKFHELCDNKGPTIVAIKSKTYDKVFGGFVDQAWTSRGGYINSQKTWLFSMTLRAKYVITDFNSHAQYAGYDNSSYGPTFGGGHDIYLASDFTSTSNYCNRYSYNFTDNTSFTGAYNFACEEVEVYSLG